VVAKIQTPRLWSGKKQLRTNYTTPPDLIGWCLSGCAILLSDPLVGACMLLDSAHCNLCTLEKKHQLHITQDVSACPAMGPCPEKLCSHFGLYGAVLQSNNKLLLMKKKLKSSLQRDPEGPSQPHVRPGTQSMSRLSNSKCHQPSLGQPNHL
jgi:hypothetical protein